MDSAGHNCAAEFAENKRRDRACASGYSNGHNAALQPAAATASTPLGRGAGVPASARVAQPARSSADRIERGLCVCDAVLANSMQSPPTRLSAPKHDTCLC